MAAIQFVTGRSNTEKFDAVEKALRSFSRRLFKTTVLMTPPVPLFSDGIDPDGTLFRRLIPFKGRIDRVAIFVGKYITRPVVIDLQLMDAVGGSTITFPLVGMITVKEVNMPISQPCILQAKALPADSIQEVMFAALTFPESDRIAKEHYVIDALLQNFESNELIETTPSEEALSE